MGSCVLLSWPGNLFAMPSTSQYANLDLESILGIEVSVTHDDPERDKELGIFRLPSIPRDTKLFFGYSYLRVEADGLAQGRREISQDFVLRDFPVTLTDMTIDIHSFHARWQPTGGFSFQASLPYVWQNTEMLTPGGPASSSTEGFGDLALRPTLHWYLRSIHTLSAGLGLSIPTGDIQRDFTGTILPYAAQVTSGSYELRPQVDLTGGFFGLKNWESGIGAAATLRLDDNEDGFKFGNIYSVDAWVKNRVTDWMDLTGYVLGTYWGGIDGVSNTLPIGMAPPFDPTNYGGEMLEIGGRVRLLDPRSTDSDRHLSLRYAVPLYQDLNGIQLRVGWSMGISSGWSF